MLSLVALLPMFTSCFDDNNNTSSTGTLSDEADHIDFATLCTDLINNKYWFKDDYGQLWYPNTSTLISSYSPKDDDGTDKNGKRVIVYYETMPRTKLLAAIPRLSICSASRTS